MYGTNEVPLFMAKDVCDILGYKNSRDTLKKHVDEEDRFQYQNEGVSNRYTPTLIPSPIPP